MPKRKAPTASKAAVSTKRRSATSTEEAAKLDSLVDKLIDRMVERGVAFNTSRRTNNKHIEHVIDNEQLASNSDASTIVTTSDVNTVHSVDASTISDNVVTHTANSGDANTVSENVVTDITFGVATKSSKDTNESSLSQTSTMIYLFEDVPAGNTLTFLKHINLFNKI